MEINVSSEWIYELESQTHWMSYWYQLKLMYGKIRKEDLIIEVGLGSGFLANYLRNKGYNIITLDIDKEKSPDVVIDITKFYPRKSFEYLCAFEVFEHLPIEHLEIFLRNVGPAIKKGIFVSVPDFKKPQVLFDLKFRRFRKTSTISLPKFKLTDKHHYWELGYKEINRNEFVGIFQHRRFRLREEFTYYRWHYFAFEVN